MFDLTGRVAVVTGASSGIGVQFAKALARQGADVAILARRVEKLESVAEEVRSLGVKCLPVKCDVTSTEAVKNAVAAVIAEFGKVDILVNNAGSSSGGAAETMSDEDWRFTIDLDLTSLFTTAREFGKHMIEAQYGRIINIASIYGNVGTGLGNVEYCAAKGGVVNFSRALAAEWAKYNITVNSLCPGFFLSELTADTLATDSFQNFIQNMVPMKRQGNEGELDAALIYLASNEASYTTGTATLVDGGYTCT